MLFQVVKMTTIKSVQVPPGFRMASFDVKSFLTNVPLEYTIGLVMERIYNKGEAVTLTYMPSHPHLCTFTSTENFHPLLPAFCSNLPQSPAFCLIETKLPRQIFSQEEKRKIGHRSI